MSLNKAETWLLSDTVKIIDEVIELSHTCYNGNRTLKHDWGYGCNDCPACRLREKGYYDYLKML